MKKFTRFYSVGSRVARYQSTMTQAEIFLVDAFLNSESYLQAVKARNDAFIYQTLRRLKRLARQPNGYFYSVPRIKGELTQ